MTTTNRIEDHHLKDGRGRTKDEPSNMQIMGSMLYTACVRKIRALLLSLMIALVPLIKVGATVALVTFLALLALYAIITMYRMVRARHEFAHIARRIDGIRYRFVVALIYVITLPGIAYLVASSIVVADVTSLAEEPAWIMCVTLLLVSVANFIASSVDDFIDGGITDLYGDDSNALVERSVDSPAEDNADDSATTTHPSGSTRTATALSGFIVGYIFGRSHR